jgi:hypothetical protein
MPTPVYIEAGSKRVFACAIDWPGWCRSGKDEAQALAALASYAPRYAAVAKEAGFPFPVSASSLKVTERLKGTATTDFGAPDRESTRDRDLLSKQEANRLADLLAASWKIFDRVVAHAPSELRKGPRGGGRDRDQIVEHVASAEAAYARKQGVRLLPPTGTADGAAMRKAILEALRQSVGRQRVAERDWPARYAARREAWHVLDHAWEIEDRSRP